MAVIKKINLFETIQIFYRIIGLHSTSIQENVPFNFRSMFVLFGPIILIASTLTYSVVNAQFVIEKVETIFVSLSGLASMMTFFIQLLKIGKILQLIQRFNVFMENGK